LTTVIPSPRGLTGYDLSADGKLFATTDISGLVCIWKLEPYRRLVDVLKNGNYERTFSPTFSRDNRLLAWTSGATGRIHFYDLDNRKRLADWQTDDLVTQISFGNNNKLSMLTSKGLTTIDLSSFYPLAVGSASATRELVHSRTNVYMVSPDPLYDQQQLDSILGESDIVTPGFWGLNNHSRETTEFNYSLNTSRGEKTDDRQGGSDCRPFFSQPVFNPYPLAFNDDKLGCSHYPLIDIRNASKGERYSESQKDWESVREVVVGEVYYGYLYLSNGAADHLDDLDIHNVRARVSLKPSEEGNYRLIGELLSDNTSSLAASLILGTPTHKTIVIGEEIEICDFRSNVIRTIKASDFLPKRHDGGKEIQIPIGDLKPGFRTDLFVRFKFLFDEEDSTRPDVNKETGTISEEAITRILRAAVTKTNKTCRPNFSFSVFNPYPLTFQNLNEECRDYPLIQGKIDHGQYPKDSQELEQGVTAHEGDNIQVLIYFDNGASENIDISKTIINNFSVNVDVDQRQGNSPTITATLSGDNVKSVSRGLGVHIGDGERLEIVRKSGILYDLQKNPIQGNFDVANNVTTMQNLLAGFNHSGFIQFTVKVVSVTAANHLPSCNSVIVAGHVEYNYDVETFAWFEWGETPVLGNVTNPQRIMKNNTEYHQLIGGLAEDTTYYYRARTSTRQGKTSGQIKSFTTARCQR
jgi:hypothetical protein